MAFVLTKLIQNIYICQLGHITISFLIPKCQGRLPYPTIVLRNKIVLYSLYFRNQFIMSSAMERKGRLETQCTDMLGVLLLNLGTVYSLQFTV